VLAQERGDAPVTDSAINKDFLHYRQHGCGTEFPNLSVHWIRIETRAVIRSYGFGYLPATPLGIESMNQQSQSPSAKASDAQSNILVRNLGEPIILNNVVMDGVAAEAVKDGQQIKVYTRLAVTSVDPLFYLVAESLTGVIRHFTRQAG
jgi:hypothetical protein